MRHLFNNTITILKANVPLLAVVSSANIRNQKGDNSNMSGYPRVMLNQIGESLMYELTDTDIQDGELRIGCYDNASADTAEQVADLVEDALRGEAPKSGSGTTWLMRRTDRTSGVMDNEQAVFLTYRYISAR